ncbi:unnamed protein product [Cuscuta campestris]|uniref:RRM domain-containing protein n=1 Tax=Cuscuta campestris TaxID=132261 RepID=A0A484LXP0_9ASTE|nr:unnamed protein product [Cuscuta campestris]
MGAKARKAQTKSVKKGAMQLAASAAPGDEAPDFLPLEGGPAKKIPVTKLKETKATVLYIGRIPHGFYEDEMTGFFQQFGMIKRLRIARNRKTGKSKHYGYIEFESPEVAKIVAETMDKYLLFEHVLQVNLIPPERVHPKLWRRVNRKFIPVDWVAIERNNLDKMRTWEEHKKLVDGIKKKDRKRVKKMEAAGIDYECPEVVGYTETAPKKIKFDTD